jgi:DNA-binding protein HU-beta
MNKGQLVAAVAENCGIAKGDTEKVINALLETIKTTLANDKSETVQFIGFGSFSISERKAREGFNPRSGEKMQIPASNSVKFKVGAALKAAVN